MYKDKDKQKQYLKEYSKEYRLKNKEKIKQYYKEYYKSWKIENEEKEKESNKTKRENNREYYSEYIKKYIPNWKKNNKDKISFYSKSRRARKFENGGSHTLSEWEELKIKHNFTCICCGRKEPFEEQYYKYLTEDHITPLSKGGSDNIDNIQPLCFKCNSVKNNKTIIY